MCSLAAGAHSEARKQAPWQAGVLGLAAALTMASPLSANAAAVRLPPIDRGVFVFKC